MSEKSIVIAIKKTDEEINILTRIKELENDNNYYENFKVYIGSFNVSKLEMTKQIINDRIKMHQFEEQL